MSLILLCGPTLLADKNLQTLLMQKYEILMVEHSSDLLRILKKTPGIRLLLLEIGADYPANIDVLRKLLARKKDLCVVVVNGESPEDAIIEALHEGAMDVFRKPYDTLLLVERIEGLMDYRR